VSVVERVRDAGRDPHCLGNGQHALDLEHFAQRLALQVLHRDEVPPVLLADLVDRDDVWMGQAPGRLGLPVEPLDPLAALRPGQIGREQEFLQRDAPPDRRIDRFVDDIVAPGDLPDDLITTESITG
jgi:hypothetical protein